MKNLETLPTIFSTCLLVLFSLFVEVNSQEVSYSTRTTQEAINDLKVPRSIPGQEIQPTSEVREIPTQSKGGWSSKLTGKEILKIKMDVRTTEDLRFIKDLGLSCCSDTGVCICEVTLEQANQIKAQRINYQIEKKEENSREQDDRWLRISQRVDRVKLRPTQVIMASMQVNTKEDLDFLRKIGVECCVDTGICKCQINTEQWKQIGFHGFRYGVRVIDTLEWGKETKPKSDKTIPEKPKPTKTSDKSQIGTQEIFVLKVEIKTGNEMQDIRKVIKRVGGQCESNDKIILLRVTQEQMEELKKEGIEFEVQK
jgi:hypothetical protein